MEYQWPLTAIFKDGKIEVVKNKDELKTLVNTYGWFGYEWIETGISRMFRYRPFYETYPKDYVPKYETAKYFEWIVRDDFGRKVDPTHIEFESRYRAWWAYGKYKEQSIAAEKGLPIPHLRNWRRRWHKKYTKTGGKGCNVRNEQFIKDFEQHKRSF